MFPRLFLLNFIPRHRNEDAHGQTGQMEEGVRHPKERNLRFFRKYIGRYFADYRIIAIFAHKHERTMEMKHTPDTLTAVNARCAAWGCFILPPLFTIINTRATAVCRHVSLLWCRMRSPQEPCGFVVFTNSLNIYEEDMAWYYGIGVACGLQQRGKDAGCSE